MRTLLAAFALLLAPLSASAAFHLWDITEVYSNADGTVQFVELENCPTVPPAVPNCNNEDLLAGHNLSSGSTVYPVTSDLPSTATAGKHVLFATPAFAAQPGAVTPDYTFPAANFLSTVADTINWAGVDFFTYNVGELPTDGYHSLNEPFGSNVRTSNVQNSPTNFQGQVGPEPSAWLLQLTGAAAVFGLARSKTPPASRSAR